MKQEQLQELIKHITRCILKEFQNIDPATTSIQKMNRGGSDSTTASDSSLDNQDSTGNDVQDTLAAKKDKLKAIRTADMNLKGTKKQTDYFNQQVKQNRAKMIAQQKELSNLKAGKTVSSGGAGAISAV